MTRRALVTGGTRGIGKQIAITLASQGHKVAVFYAGNDSAAKEFEEANGIKAIKCDVSNYDNCVLSVAEAERHLGGNIEILVNNAGITRDNMIHKMPVSDWDLVIKTNLSSAFYMTRTVIENMRNAKFGRIICISSVNAHGMLGQTNYSAAKAGIEGLIKSIALEGARLGITANAVAPGYVNTEMVGSMPPEALDKIKARIPLQRLGEAEEIARVVAFIADDASSFITGAVIPVNGGLRV